MHTAWKVPFRRIYPVQRRRKRKASAVEICCNLQFREDDSYSWHRRSNSQGMLLWGIQEKVCTLHGRCQLGASVQYSGGGKGKRALTRYAAIFNSERTTRIRGTEEAISQGMQLWGIQEKLCTLHGRCQIGASVQYSGGGKGKRALEIYAAIFNSERTTRIRGTAEAIHKECNSGEYRRSMCKKGTREVWIVVGS
jgi:uncharacterized glyoxalase superfamily protein PhnB